MKIDTPWGVKKIDRPCKTHNDSDDKIVGAVNKNRWIYQCNDCGMIWIEGQQPSIVPDSTPVTYC